MEASCNVIYLNVVRFTRRLALEDGGAYPERRLWQAVIISALTEYEEWLQRIEIAQRLESQVNTNYLKTLTKIRRECEDPWFAHVCDMANVPYENVHFRLDRLDREYCLGAVRWTDRGGEELQTYYIRKARERKLKNHG